MRGVLAAFLFVVLMVGPSLDSVMCAADDLQSPPAAQATLASVDHGSKPHQTGAPGSCAHGHCHPGASILDPAIGPLAAVETVSMRLFPSTAAALASQPPSRLEDPPRA
jgi:hypothetical protein